MFQPQMREEIGRLRVEEGRSIKSLSEQFGVSVGSVSRWSHDYMNSPRSGQARQTLESLTRENESLRKENERLASEAEKAKIESGVLREVIRTIASGQRDPDSSSYTITM